ATADRAACPARTRGSAVVEGAADRPGGAPARRDDGDDDATPAGGAVDGEPAVGEHLQCGTGAGAEVNGGGAGQVRAADGEAGALHGDRGSAGDRPAGRRHRGDTGTARCGEGVEGRGVPHVSLDEVPRDGRVPVVAPRGAPRVLDLYAGAVVADDEDLVPAV